MKLPITIENNLTNLKEKLLNNVGQVLFQFLFDVMKGKSCELQKKKKKKKRETECCIVVNGH
jgi:hypothetical protein